MAGYEYRRVVVNLNASHPDDELVTLGKQGWDCYTVMPVPGSTNVVHFLKRPLEMDAPEEPKHRPVPVLKRR